MNLVTRPIFEFMDNLTNWYIRRSRRRFWKSENDQDKLFAYHTLYEVLVETAKVIAPVMPFVSEEVYKNLTSKESVHLEFFPSFNEKLIDESLIKDMDKAQKIINL
jgi:isoleucyl-tRNA synthetase